MWIICPDACNYLNSSVYIFLCLIWPDLSFRCQSQTRYSNYFIIHKTSQLCLHAMPSSLRVYLRPDHVCATTKSRFIASFRSSDEFTSFRVPFKWWREFIRWNHPSQDALCTRVQEEKNGLFDIRCGVGLTKPLNDSYLVFILDNEYRSLRLAMQIPSLFRMRTQNILSFFCL